MKTIGKISTIALLIGIFTSCSQAQTRGDRSPEERAQLQTEMMTEALSLSEDQIPQVEDINMKYSEKLANIQAQSGNRRSKFQAARGLMEEKGAELEAVLTADQYAIYQEKKAEMRAKMKEKRKKQSKLQDASR